MSKVLAEISYQIRYALPIWLSLLLCSWLPDLSFTIRIRGFLVSIFLPGRPKRLTIGRDVTILSAARFYVGDDVYVAKGCWINAIGTITIENEVVLAPYVVISSSNHGFRDGSVKRGGAHPAPVRVCYGSWLAAHSVITAGVTIGRGNLVAANSVVTKSTDDNVVVAGVPADRISAREDNPSSINSKHDIE